MQPRSIPIVALFVASLASVGNACITAGQSVALSCALTCHTAAQTRGAPVQSNGSGTLVDVIIENFAYTPSIITIAPGDSVRWTNLDAIEHTATHLSLTPIWDSGLLAQNGSFTFTFNDVGTFDYFCTPHGSSMLGTVVVAVPEPAMLGIGSIICIALSLHRRSRKHWRS